MFMFVLSRDTSPSREMATFTMSGLKSRFALDALGSSTCLDSSLIMLRLAIMKDASRKNMISISGMISIRALRCGNGEPIFIYHSFGRGRFGRNINRHIFHARTPDDIQNVNDDLVRGFRVATDEHGHSRIGL